MDERPAFIFTTEELISETVEYSDRRSWFQTLIEIRSFDETPERVHA